jgi:hypothetical protein
VTSYKHHTVAQNITINQASPENIKVWIRIRVMVFNATFNNISVILVEETSVI